MNTAGYYTESNYENAVLQLFNEGLGYTYIYGPVWSVIIILRSTRIFCHLAAYQ